MRLFGRTHSTRSAASAVARPLLAIGLITGSLFGLLSGPASANWQQAGATIKQTGMTAHGTWAMLEWTANVPSTTVQVSSSPPTLTNGKWSFANAVYAATAYKQNDAFAEQVTGLNPATKYHVILTTPATGNMVSTQALGQFTTLARTQVVVTFNQIHVTDDADGGAKGAGDLWWYFNTTFAGWSDGWQKSAHSGDTIQVNFPDDPNASRPVPYKVTGTNVPNAFEVIIQAVEDDTWGYGDSGCPAYDKPNPTFPYEDAESCSQAGYTSKNISLPTFVFESQITPFTMATSSGPVKFSVTGTVTATYA